MSTDISAIINSFFVRYSQEFRQDKLEAFELIMALAMSHAYGCCNPKQWGDYLGIQPQKIYAEIQKWSLYRLKEVLVKMMVHQAAEQIKSLTQIMRKLRRECNLLQLLSEHFHLDFLGITAIS